MRALGEWHGRRVYGEGLACVSVDRSGGRRVKRQHQRTDVEGVAVGERDLPRDRLATPQGAVLAVEVLQHGPVGGDEQPGVPPRHRGLVELDVDVGIAPDDVFAKRQGKAPVTPREPARRMGGGRLAARRTR